ncbi:MAG: polysaccharide deacetylase family protein [Anaerobacillus sp.]|uniref:polysaccharide deacetylase family protein n=1 Tax=Anaerobacillus sp. TaxID=1872506 RepID=UPI00391DD921
MRNIILVSMVMITLFIFIFVSVDKESILIGDDHEIIERPPLNQVIGTSLRLNNNDLEKLKFAISNVKNTRFDKPSEWGESVTGVIQRISTEEKIVSLTFDACGGEWGSGYDEALINYLVAENVPATLFINSRWIDENLETFLYLASLDQFQIENHGTEHRPLSITGKTAWGIKGTSSVDEVIGEIVTNFEKIKELTGHSSRYFRSGTAFYDNIAVEIVEQLGMNVVNYDILGDAGATFSATQVRDALLTAKPGSIALLHMNQPTKGTFEGVKMAIPLLREQGFTFVTLDEGFNLSIR